MAYLYNVHIVIEENLEEQSIQNDIDNAIEQINQKHSNMHFVGVTIRDLEGQNFGKCSNCGTWVSDHDEINSIECFSDGCVIDGQWVCDLCLPDNHPKRFV